MSVGVSRCSWIGKAQPSSCAGSFDTSSSPEGTLETHTELTLWPGVSLSFLRMLLAVTGLGQNKTLGRLQKMID